MSVFLHIPGITGESSDSAHNGWIDIAAWKWSVERSITSNTSTRGDRESSNAKISDLLISKYFDKASLPIFMEACCGTGKDITLHLTKTGAGNGADVYLEYVLKNAIISGYDVGGTDQDVRRPIENITISFVEIEAKYTSYDENGIAESPVAVGFDTATNTKK